MKLDDEFLDALARMHAALARYAHHDWDRAERLPLPVLFERYGALSQLLKAENDANKGK